MIRRLSRVMGMIAGTAFGTMVCVYGASELISQCLRCILP